MTPRDQAWLDDAVDAFDLLYFSGALAEKHVSARWHKFRTRGTSTRFGQCYLDTMRIEINVVLSQEWVPTYFVLDVMHHELLHALLGPHHDHAFRLCEMRFAHHAKAAVWEAYNEGLVIAASAELCKRRPKA